MLKEVQAIATKCLQNGEETYAQTFPPQLRVIVVLPTWLCQEVITYISDTF